MTRSDENVSILHGWFEIVPAQANLAQLETTGAESLIRKEILLGLNQAFQELRLPELESSLG